MVRSSLRSLLLAALGLALASVADAATLISTATGNIGTTATWSVVDTTGTNAFLNSETANTALTTSGVASSTFTPASETVTAIGVKLASVAAAPSGTLTVKLANSTSPGTRECTQTVNVADLAVTNGAPTAATADGGWVILTCSASPNGTDAYTITANTSVAAQVNLFSLATTNWSRLLVTSGTQTNGPAAGDKFYVFGQMTGAGTHNAYVVTIDTTSAVAYGNVANTLVDPSIAVGQWGALQFGSTASTAYVSQFAGPMVVYNSGTYSVGTSGTPIPSTGSATLTMNSTVEGDTGIIVRNGGTMNVAGSSGGRNVVKTKLTTTANAAATSLTVADTTGWLSGDSIVIAPTALGGGSNFDAVAMSGNASGTTLPVGALTNQHTATTLSYTSSSTGVAYAMNMYADVILLTRNVVIQGGSSSNNGYVLFQPNSIGAMTWVRFDQISGVFATAGKRGIEVDTGPLGSFSLTNFSLTNSHNTTLLLAGTNTKFGGALGNYVTVQNGSMYNCASNSTGTNYGVGIGAGALIKNPYWKVDNFAAVRVATGTFSAKAIFTNAANGQFSNISISGSAAGGVAALTLGANYDASSLIGGQIGNTFGPFTTYANIGYPVAMPGYGLNGTISGLYIWHEQGRFQPLAQNGHAVYDPFFIVSSAFGIYIPFQAGNVGVFRNGVIGWDTTQGSAQFPVTIDDVNTTIALENMELCPNGSLGGVTWIGCGAGPVSLVHDLAGVGGGIGSNGRAFLRNTSILNQGTAYPTQNQEEAWYGIQAFVVHDCSACSPVKHDAWLPGGFIHYDTTVTHSSGYSLRMTPRVPTFSGYISGTALTVTSASFGGAVGDNLTSNGSGFVPGTLTVSGTFPNFVVTHPQTVGSSGSPVQFQIYNPTPRGGLMRLQSAPYDRGLTVAVASGQAANVCVWARPSISTDAAPPWGGSAVTYNGDAPRMIVRANPYMGLQGDTVMGTSSLTAGSWSQFCANTPTAAADGEFEIVIDSDQTFTSNAGGSVNVAEWSCTTCSATNNTQFWWNGAPGNGLAPPAAGGLLVNPGMHGGMQ